MALPVFPRQIAVYFVCSCCLHAGHWGRGSGGRVHTWDSPASQEGGWPPQQQGSTRTWSLWQGHTVMEGNHTTFGSRPTSGARSPYRRLGDGPGGVRSVMTQLLKLAPFPISARLSTAQVSVGCMALGVDTLSSGWGRWASAGTHRSGSLPVCTRGGDPAG